MAATRRVKSRSGRGLSRKTNKSKPAFIQHHHLLLRMELIRCPGKHDIPKVKRMVHDIVAALDMKLLDRPHIYYLDKPENNKGMTCIAPIQTSHIAFHFWKNPDANILHQPASKCLLEFDIYTCGNLTIRQIHSVLHHLTIYRPTHVDMHLLNRMVSLKTDRMLHWNREHSLSWAQWLDSSAFMN